MTIHHSGTKTQGRGYRRTITELKDEIARLKRQHRKDVDRVARAFRGYLDEAEDKIKDVMGSVRKFRVHRRRGCLHPNGWTNMFTLPNGDRLYYCVRCSALRRNDQTLF